ncbi:MAG TPA: allantoate amidohydrolase [Verrucomicrobiae bacterium]|nr:allantoate amidohydrolase [Verrucomicrobiae bacterium]
MKLAQLVMQRCDELGAISDERGCLTRTFASPAMRRANKLVGSWMREAGLQVREDAAFNLIGGLPGTGRGAKTLLLGSHLDTVRNAGKYDGPLGVLVAIAAVQLLRERNVKLPFHLEVVGFSDEEGVRYQTTYLGSRALAGTLTAADLARIKEKQIVKARRKRGEFLGYAEVHIEQGPVLELKKLPVAVVTAIAGQSRLQVEFSGVAGHAGTVPMNSRQDALAGAAAFVLAAESVASRSAGAVATVGKLGVDHGASNVIPGHVSCTLDVRHQNDVRCAAVMRALHNRAKAIAKYRKLKLTWTLVQQTAAVPCDPTLTQIFSKCVAQQGLEVLKLPSGAGHDAAALSAICPVAMLFVRCQGGISHNPAESVKTTDVAPAIGVLADFIQTLAVRHA